MNELAWAGTLNSLRPKRAALFVRAASWWESCRSSRRSTGDFLAGPR